MKRTVFFTLFTLVTLLPSLSQAATLCATDQFGSFFVFNIKPACSKFSTKVATVTGRWHINPQTCDGRRTWGLHGTCLGSPTSQEIRLNLTSEITAAGCSATSWGMRGGAPNSATGGSRNILGGAASIIFT